MDSPRPIAYLLTWTTYGTWLHGHSRGSVDEQHNTFGDPRLPKDARRMEWERELATQTTLTLDYASRRAVRDAIIEHCDFRDVAMLAISVRTNHVHMVTPPSSEDPGRLVGRFKAWATRRLREASLVTADAKVWTHRSSTRYLWKTTEVFGAIRYVLHEQGPPDEFTVAGLRCPEVCKAPPVR